MTSPEEYKTALEEEIKRWHGFWNALRRDDREAFESMMDIGRSYVAEGSSAPKVPTFQPMLLSILLAQRRQITQLDEDLKPLRPPPAPPPEKPPSKTQQPTIVYFKKKKPGGEQTRLSSKPEW